MPTNRAPVRFLAHILPIAAFCSAPAPVAATCGLAADLARLHGAYSDVVNGDGTPRADIGRYVINQNLIAPSGQNFIETLNASGFYESMEDIGPALEGMAELVSNRPGSIGESRHRANLASLEASLRNTGCFEEPNDRASDGEALTGGSGQAGPGGGSGENDGEQDGPDHPIEHVSRWITENAPSSYAILAGTGLFVCAAGLYGRRLMMRARARAYPRFPLGVPLSIGDVYGRRSQRVAINISRGGLIVERDDLCTPSDYERASVRLAETDHSLRLRWENTHFLAFEFLDPIEEEELQAVLSSAHTILRKTNSAPEGAANIEPSVGLAL